MISSSVKTQNKNNRIWCNFLTSQVLFSEFQGEGNLRVNLYAPNTIFRQFGFAQVILAPLVLEELRQLDNAEVPSRDHLVDAQDDNESQHSFYHPSTVNTCIYTTPSFSKWWDSYYKSI